jgi:rod shape-determining protein MreD
VRRALSLSAVIVIGLLLQSTLFSQIELGGAKPELMYLLTASVALLEGPASGAVAGFAGGMAQDFLLNQPKGITALTLTLLGYAVGMLRQYTISPSPMLPVVVVAGATFGGVLFYGLMSFLLGQLLLGVVELLRIAVLSSLYNALLTPVFYPAIRRVAEASRSKRVFRW